jgi:hypothetical protein
MKELGLVPDQREGNLYIRICCCARCADNISTPLASLVNKRNQTLRNLHHHITLVRQRRVCVYFLYVFLFSVYSDFLSILMSTLRGWPTQGFAGRAGKPSRATHKRARDRSAQREITQDCAE